jgi:hypothetical protein
VVTDFFPTLDEVALQADSTPAGGPVDASGWFTRGFQGYFAAFPEWSPAPSDYWRPLVNAYYWVSYQLFDHHWGAQLLVGYAAHALVVGLVAYLVLLLLRLNPWLAAAAIAIAALNPAFVHQDLLRDPLSIPRAIQYPIYQVEVLDALIMILAVIAFLRRRFVWFGLLATMALLLKETAISLPLCALAVPSVWRTADGSELRKRLACMVVPLLLWSAGILGASLLPHSDSIYALALHWPRQALGQLPRRILLLPTGLLQASVAQIKGALSAHQLGSVAVYGAEVLVNTAWWLALAAACRQAVRERGPEATASVEHWKPVLLFAAGNLLLALILLPSELRFCYLWFALGPAALFAALGRLRRGVMLALLLALALVLPQVASLAAALSAQPLGAYRLARGGARQLSELLAALPATATTAFLLDDMAVQTSAPEYFARLSGFRGQLVLVNIALPVPGCSSASTDSSYRLSPLARGGGSLLDYRAQICLQAPWNVPPLASFNADDVIDRGPYLHYRYPDLVAAAHQAGLAYDLGRRFELTATDPRCVPSGACVWIGFDWPARRYVLLTAQSAPDPSAAQ